MNTLIIFLFPFFTLASDGKSQKLDTIYKKCLQNSVMEGKDQQSVCDCLKTNYQNRFDEKALGTLILAHEGRLEKEKIQENEEILEFDLLASEKCVEDSQWRWQPPKLEKEKTPAPAKTQKKEKKKQL